MAGDDLLGLDAMGPRMWESCLWCVAAILVFTAAMHLVALVRWVLLLRKGRLWAHRAVFPHFVRAVIIGSTTVLCCFVRGIALLLRQSRVPLFREGALSFNDPWFTLVYNAFLMNLPSFVVAVAFFGLATNDVATADAAASAPLMGTGSAANTSVALPAVATYSGHGDGLDDAHATALPGGLSRASLCSEES